MTENKSFGLRIKRLKVNNLDIETEIKEKLIYIQNIAIQLGWRIHAYYYKGKRSRLVLSKEYVECTIYLNTNTVSTKIDHPKYPKPTILKRENLELKDIGSILFDPRVHTKIGKLIKHKKKRYSNAEHRVLRKYP